MRGPGFWKFNNSHLQNYRFKEIVRMQLVEIVNEYQNNDDERLDLMELLEMTPTQLQKVKLIWSNLMRGEKKNRGEKNKLKK